MHRGAWLVAVAILAAGCSGSTASVAPSTVAETTTSTATTTTPASRDLDSPVSSLEEAFCVGAVQALEEWAEQIGGSAEQASLLDMTLEGCVAEEGIALSRADYEAAGVEADFSIAYSTGCLLPTMIGVTIMSEDQGLADEEFVRAMAESLCLQPFTNAYESNWGFKVLRTGVCYTDMGFEPSAEQIESGMVPCP